MVIIFLLVFILSPWVWKIASVNLFILIVIFVASFLLLRKIESKKIAGLSIVISFVVLGFFQYRTTNISSLTKLSEIEKTVQIERMREYPSPRMAHIIEERPESIALTRLQNNLFENLDVNLYFFGNYPRSRVGYDEFEKFFYILIPFFAIGLIKILEDKQSLLLRSKKIREVGISFFVPLLFLSVIGNKNPMGPFLLFPFFIVSICKGIYEVFKRK